MAAPCGFPDMSGDFDDPELFVDSEAELIRAGRARYEALPVAEHWGGSTRFQITNSEVTLDAIQTVMGHKSWETPKTPVMSALLK